MSDVIERRVINISDLIEAAPIGAVQYRIVTLCAVLALLDGFDTQAVAFVAPVLAAQWHIDLALLGPVFAAGLAGLMIGALAFGSAADWIGRKPALIVSTLIFGIFAGATAYATSTGGLLALRFLHWDRTRWRNAEHHSADIGIHAKARPSHGHQPYVLRLSARRRTRRLASGLDYPGLGLCFCSVVPRRWRWCLFWRC